MKNNYPKIILAIAITIFVVLIVIFAFQFQNKGFVQILQGAGNLGGFIGGVFSFLGLVLIYFTIVYQLNTFKLAQFESKFYEMIRLHNENVQQFRHKLPTSKEDEIQMEEGSRVFMYINQEIQYAIKKIIHYLREHQEEDDQNNQVKQKNADETEKENKKNEDDPLDIKDISASIKDIYTESYYEACCDRHALIQQYEIKDICELILFDLAYTVVYYGLTRGGRTSVNKILANKYNQEKISGLLDSLQAIPTEWDEGHKQGNIEERIEKNRHFKYFGGHQDRLGHYYRQFFHAIRFVNDQDFLSYEEKEFYMKLYRAQLSNYEQLVLFYNSMSQIGRTWEYDAGEKGMSKKALLNKQLITKFNLIRNIPYGMVKSYRLDKYYPIVNFIGPVSPRRKKLIAKYD